MERTCYTYLPTPIGRLLLADRGAGLSCIAFPGGKSARLPEPDWEVNETPFREVIRQLEAYFSGKLHRFELQLAPEGTPFQRKVWEALCEIPYGATATYGEIACRIGKPKAVRAVGAANGRNPLPIVVPCHRVIGKDGSLVGFGGGLQIKEALLALEKSGQKGKMRPYPSIRGF
jgi:methylated-DNA-[protein]-cysteine S-methyltransferase